eukprot:9467795-Pyramimonas_sp.AAC.1
MSWRRLEAQSSTSSAKRAFVMRVCGANPYWIPNFLRDQIVLTCLKTCSRTALNNKKLSGSPCFTPRSTLKDLLLVSVLIVP